MVPSTSMSHAELEWASPSLRKVYLELAKRFRLIRYDPRGGGLSDDSSPDVNRAVGFARDTKAVAEALDIESFHLCGSQSQGPMAVAFAAENPEMVIGLILCDTGPSSVS